MNFFKSVLNGIIIAMAITPVAMTTVMVQAETISVSCSAVGLELQLCREAAEAWSRKTGHEINLISTPNSTTERLVPLRINT